MKSKTMNIEALQCAIAAAGIDGSGFIICSEITQEQVQQRVKELLIFSAGTGSGKSFFDLREAPADLDIKKPVRETKHWDHLRKSRW